MIKKYSKITKIVKNGKSDVLDFTVKDTHRILANNFYTSNCSIKHPDSEEFVDAKMDGTKVTGANVSIKAHDDFMKAVTGNGKYTQQYPIDSDNPRVTKEIDAKKLWKKIIHNAWKSAEPGVLFWDKVISESLPDRYEGYETVSTNPCLVGDTIIKTTKGDIPIKKIVEDFNNGENFEVYTYNEKTKEININNVHNAMLSKKNTNIIKLIMEDGSELKLTPDHKVFTEERGWIEASQLTSNETLIGIDE